MILGGDPTTQLTEESTADWLIGPSVSTAIGWNEYEAGRSEHLTSFLLLLLSFVKKYVKIHSHMHLN